MTNPFDLTGLPTLLQPLIYKASGLGHVRDWYNQWQKHAHQTNQNGEFLTPPSDKLDEFLDSAFNKLGVTLTCDNHHYLDQLPTTGPLLIVANHPLGALEGMLLTRKLREYRPDLKVLTNDLLLKIPEFNDVFIGVDVLNTGKAQSNATGIRRISKHLSNGGALLVFPAGTVSRINVRTWSIADPEWSPMIGKLAKKYRTTCLPAYVHGRNSWAFYLSGLINKRLRTALIPRALLKQQGKTVRIQFGQPIKPGFLNDTPDNSVTTQLRFHCELLADNCEEDKNTPPQKTLPIQSSIAKHLLSQQIAALSSYKIASNRGLEVYCAPFDKMGCLAEQLAVEREQTFRNAGEGTGLKRDLDRFDQHYLHIFLWDTKTQRIAGGYRAINVSHAINKDSLDTLYSHSVFRYKRSFLQALGGAIEVGRSFIIEEFQSTPYALDLLWKGLGSVVNQYPECHTLFGCVSIPATYSPLVRSLLADTLLNAHGADQQLRSLVKPAARFNSPRRFWSPDFIHSLNGISAVNKLLGHASPTQKVPVLLRHYVSMNGKLVDFSINHGFNQSLDGLIVVDLRQSPHKYIKRYMGADAAVELIRNWEKYRNAA